MVNLRIMDDPDHMFTVSSIRAWSSCCVLGYGAL